MFGFSRALALRILLVFATTSLHAQATPAGGMISGRVVDIDSGEPLPGARVSLATGDAARTMTAGLTANTVIADTEGRFMFSGLRPGVHAIVTLTTEANVTNRPSPPSLVHLEANEIVRDVTVRSVRSAWIKGRVTDETGQPVVGISVVAFSRAPNGSPSAFAASGSSITNDLGGYNIDPLMPGDYIVCACQWMAPLLDRGLTHTLGLLGPTQRSSDVPVEVDSDWRPPVRTFYPSATQPGQATIITLRSNEGRTDIHIGGTSGRLATVTGRITGITEAVPASAIRLQAESQPGDPILSGLEPDAVAADGAFRFRDVPPGNYTLRVRYRGSNTSTRPANGLAQRLGAVPAPPRIAPAQNDISLWSETPLVVDGRDLHDVQVTVDPALHFSGVVRLSNQGRLEPLRANGGKLERLDEPIDGPSVSSSVRADDDGVFELEGLIPGRYQFQWTILPPGLSLKSVRFGGRDVTDLPFVIEAGQTSAFEITLVDNDAGTVRGRVVSTRVESAPHLVVAFPSDRMFWDEPAVADRRFVQATPDQHGQFQLEDVPPGQYVIAPLHAADRARGWRSKLRLEALAATGRQVTVVQGENPPVEIRK